MSRGVPHLGDIHTIANAYEDRPSISIHVYGGNIGRIRRSIYDPATGATKSFISGYSNARPQSLVLGERLDNQRCGGRSGK